MQTQKRAQPAWLALWVGLMMASWPFNLILGKVALRYFPALALASFRLILAALLMAPLYWWMRSRMADDLAKRKFDRQDLKTFVKLGVLGMVINQSCFIIGLKYTTVGHSALIMGLGPIIVFILAWAHGLEAATSRKISGLLMAFTGVTVLSLEKGMQVRSGMLTGDLITLCGSAAFALYTVEAKKVTSKYDAVTMTSFSYAVTAILLLPLAGYEAVVMSRSNLFASVEWQGWAGFAYLTVFGSVFAFLLYTWALRYLTASRMGALIYAHPVVATALGVLWLGERVTLNLVIGGILILVGIYLIQSGREPATSTAVAAGQAAN